MCKFNLPRRLNHNGFAPLEIIHINCRMHSLKRRSPCPIRRTVYMQCPEFCICSKSEKNGPLLHNAVLTKKYVWHAFMNKNYTINDTIWYENNNKWTFHTHINYFRCVRRPLPARATFRVVYFIFLVQYMHRLLRLSHFFQPCLNRL